MLLKDPRKGFSEVARQHDVGQLFSRVGHGKDRAEILRRTGDRCRLCGDRLACGNPGFVQDVLDPSGHDTMADTRLACGELESYGPEAPIIAIDVCPDELLDEFGSGHD